MIDRSRTRRSTLAGRRHQAGFTMVELIVSLLAGLIVATGIVALSREATNSFHEEARSSVAEAAMRTAIDRLRADLQRAGYMSTGNILADPTIAAGPGGAHVATTAPKSTSATAPRMALATLASLFLIDGGSQANLASASAVGPGTLSPDLIDIAGNMTSTDAFDVAYIAQTAVGSCINIFLSTTSPAMYRIMGAGDAGVTELGAIFQPDPTGTATFIVRLVDDSGRAQFLQTCVPAVGVLGGQPYVSVNNATTPIRTAQTTGTVSGLTGYAAGRSWVNPVQIVQWEITATSSTVDQEPAQFTNGLEATSDGGTDPTKFDLMRSYLDAAGNIVAATSEIVAEYVVDLSFAFSVDKSTSQAAPNIVTYAFDDATDNDPIAAAITNATTMYPQRIRSVRARLVTRTAQADRTVNIAPAPANYGSQNFMYRYCVSGCPSPATGALAWARTRTVTTEVALPNQARNFY
jgi:Tfp pilus assembly protein PilW